MHTTAATKYNTDTVVITILLRSWSKFKVFIVRAVICIHVHVCLLFHTFYNFNIWILCVRVRVLELCILLHFDLPNVCNLIAKTCSLVDAYVRFLISVMCICWWGTRWPSWLRHCVTSRKVGGSIPDGVIGIFYWHSPAVLWSWDRLSL